MLSHGEKSIAKQLVNRESHAIVISCLSEKYLLRRDKFILVHDFRGLILGDLMVSVQITRSEGTRVINLLLFSQLSLFSC